LLIVVGVGLDTAAQIEAHLISRSYEGFMMGGSLKGRRDYAWIFSHAYNITRPPRCRKRDAV
jgi:hypothetical protein